MSTILSGNITPLRRVRREKGITQRWMAEQLGVHPKTFQNYEFGRTRIPRSIIFHAAYLLHITPEELSHVQVHP
jgi:transcriptional regulator with XRE-family HTH domain